MDGRRIDALAKALAVGGSRRRLLGGLLGAGALAGGFGPAAERAGAAPSLARCQGIDDKKKRKQCLTCAKKGKRNDVCRGFLKNFAFTVVNNSSRDWWFAVGSYCIGCRFRKESVPKNSTKRLLVEDDDAIFFVPNGSTNKSGEPLGGVAAFTNPTFGEAIKTSTCSGSRFDRDGDVVTMSCDSGSLVEIDVGDSRTITFGSASFVVKRTKDSDHYKEFTLTFD